MKSMGLDELKPFKQEEKVIEYLIEADDEEETGRCDLHRLGEETASSPRLRAAVRFPLTWVRWALPWVR